MTKSGSVLFNFLRVPQMSEMKERASTDEAASVLAHFSFGSIALAGYVACE